MEDRFDRVARVLSEALDVLERADVPPELRTAALPEAIRLIDRTEAPTDVGGSTQQDEEELGGAVASLEKLGKRLDLPMEVLTDIYYVDGDALQLTAPSRKIAPSKKEGTAEIAVLVTVGRQGAGLDNDLTSVNEVRHWARELGRYDDKHFGEHLQGADNVLTIIGKGMQRNLRTKWHEKEQLREIIQRVAGRG
jgi:hypothetical protein